MPVTEKQKANLRKIPKGVSGNPAGKPKGTLSAKTVIDKWLKAVVKHEDPNGKEIKVSAHDAITLALIAKAKNGDVLAYNALMDRKEGRPKTSIDLQGNIGLTDGPIEFE